MSSAGLWSAGTDTSAVGAAAARSSRAKPSPRVKVTIHGLPSTSPVTRTHD
jgi:hypothetical protein